MDTSGQNPRGQRAADSLPPAPETPLIPLSQPSGSGEAPKRKAPGHREKNRGQTRAPRRQTQPKPVPKQAAGAPKRIPAQRAGMGNMPGTARPNAAPSAAPAQTKRERAVRQISYGDALRRRRRRKIISWLLGAVVLSTGLIVSLRVLLKVETISVTGDAPYTAEQVIQSLPFEKGDSMLTVNAAGAARELERTLPYIGEAKIVKKLPDVVEIQLTAAHDTYCVTSISGWAVVSENFKILRVTMEPPEDLIEISGAEADAPLAGAVLSLTDEDKQEALDSLIAALRSTEFPAVTAIEMESIYEIAVHCGNVKVLIGTVNELEEKLDWAKYLLVDMQVQGEQSGTLDVSTRNSEGRLTGNWIPG